MNTASNNLLRRSKLKKSLSLAKLLKKIFSEAATRVTTSINLPPNEIPTEPQESKKSLFVSLIVSQSPGNLSTQELWRNKYR